MKKILLWSSCVLLFLSLLACSKESQMTLKISAKTWVVTANSPGGVEGDEYKFLDNHLYFHYQGDVLQNDGKWEFDFYSSYDPSQEIIVKSDQGELLYTIDKITDTELELSEYFPLIGNTVKIILRAK